jgi:hypothetical protein
MMPLRRGLHIIKDEESNTANGFEQAAIAAVSPSEGERFEQARDAVSAQP